MTTEQLDRPNDIREYSAWLQERHNVSIDRRTRTHYESVAAKLSTSFEGSRYWSRLHSNLRDYDEEYLTQKGYRLWMEPDRKPEIIMKPFDSFLLKTFRRNVLDNANWPDPPAGGWLLPGNWYSEVRDVVRTSLIVKYIDGVEFLCDKLRELSETNTLQSELSFEAREDGYYAAHFTVASPTEIPKIDFDTEVIDGWLELQVTTQLQEVIRRMLHFYYEKKRQATKEDKNRIWQWDYGSDEFVANYLGHILHYVEGMIMEVRARTTEAATSREVKQ